MSKRVSFSEEVETKTIAEIDRQSEESRSDEEARQFNKFQLLKLADGLDVENANGDESVDEAIHTDESESESTAKAKSQPLAKQAKGKSSKKSRGRKNKKSKSLKGDKNKETEFSIDLVNSDVDIEIDKSQLYKEHNEHIKLLKLDTRNLLPENELKKMFGRSVVRDDRSRNQGHGGQRSKFVNLRYVDFGKTATFNGSKMELDDFLNEVQKIKEQDVQPKQSSASSKGNKNKSNVGKTATTNPVDSLINSGRPVYFKFVHDKDYQAAQHEFVQAVHLAHPEAIVHNLSMYPHHAESLLQLSYIIRLSEDYKQASEMIEQALLVFERGFHTRFNMATAQCRLSYRRPENRTFFIVLFEQIISCHRRGLRKTPFEYSKLLLSLEPENDPLLAIQLLDFFALRSEEYDFLIDFYNSWWQVQKLPNFNFSLAMAYFYKSKNNKQSKLDCDRFIKLADEQLQKSLLLFPNFILPLLDACSGEPSAELKKCTYFDYSPYGNKYKTVPETLEVLIELYVKRSFGLWKQKQTLAWLEKNVADMVSKFASGEIKEDNKKLTEHWAQFKKPAPKNLLRHIALSDLKVKMPASASASTFMAIDPFPPTDAIDTYHSNLHTTQRSAQTSSDSSLSSLFLRSFLPSFSMTEQRPSNAAPSSAPSSGQPSNRIDTDLEVALGDFVMDEIEGAQQPGGESGQVDFNALHDSVRNLASTLTNLIRLTPMIGEQRENLADAARGARRNNENQDEHNDRDQQQDNA